MAPLNPANTARYKVYYTANGLPHVTQFRYAQGEGPGQPDLLWRTDIAVFLNAVAAWMPSDLTYTTATYIPEGLNIELPADLPPLLSAGAQSVNLAAGPAMLTMTGKSTNGRRWSQKMYGLTVNPINAPGYAADYRVAGSENAVAAAIISSMQEAETLAIDGLVPLVNPYVNLGYSAYWQEEVRTG